MNRAGQPCPFLLSVGGSSTRIPLAEDSLRLPRKRGTQTGPAKRPRGNTTRGAGVEQTDTLLD
ncbi:MAG: hypothetical protein K9N51_03565, partial [Candidatus Pacebacteria bacterium]|nr:hypothetical protein [Candidatus Paceibacterota bacterium]